jgi:hypothetical protein
VWACTLRPNPAFVEGATVTSDAQGRYRADLVKFPWPTAATRALVLAPGYKVRDGKVEAGTQTATSDFELGVTDKLGVTDTHLCESFANHRHPLSRWQAMRFARTRPLISPPIPATHFSRGVGRGTIVFRPRPAVGDTHLPAARIWLTTPSLRSALNRVA